MSSNVKRKRDVTYRSVLRIILITGLLIMLIISQTGSASANANTATWWNFTTRVGAPGKFAKNGPSLGASGVPLNPVLGWNVSSGATSYEYCYNTTPGNDCSGIWISTGTQTNVTLSSLSYNTTYYWQVRATDAGEATYANDNIGWSFTTVAGPHVWTNPGPAGGFVYAIAINPQASNILYAATIDNGIFNSSDGGATWSAINTGLTNIHTWTVAIDPVTPTTLYTRTDTGLFKTTNGGGNWNAVNTGGFTGSMTYDILEIDPVTSGTLYMGVGQDLLKSTNGGETWSLISVSQMKNTQSLVIDPKMPNTLYAVTSGGVFKSTDGGTTWNTANTGLTNISIQTLAMDPVIPTTLYVITSGGVFKSMNSGETWNLISTSLTNTWRPHLIIDPMTPTTLYVTTYSNGLFKSTNGGESWSAIKVGDLTNLSGLNLTIDPAQPTTLYVGSYSGIFKSTDSGEHWNESGLIATIIRTLIFDPAANLYAGARGGVLKSSSPVGSWNKLNTGLTASYVNSLVIDPLTPTTFYAGTYLGGVYKSINSGQSWFSSGMANLSGREWLTLAIAPTTPITLYAGVYNFDAYSSKGLFKSTDSGRSWIEINSDLTDTTISTLTIDPLTPTTLYVNGRIKSTDSGKNWSAMGAGLPQVNAMSIAPQAPTILYVGTNAGMYKSTNGGESWSAISAGLPDNTRITALAIDPKTPTLLYAGTNGNVYGSANGGGDWQVVGAGLPNIAINTLILHPETPNILYAGTDGLGVFSITLAPPDAFAKTSPTHLSAGLDTTLTFSWEASSGANGYEYCYDTSDDNACSGIWVSTGTDTQAQLSGLNKNTTYFWQVRAVNPDGSTYANDDTWWSFGTLINPPGAFAKTNPANAFVTTDPIILQWEPSAYSTSYEYCYDTSNNSECNATWISTGTNTSVSLPKLTPDTTYYWQVRAVNAGETTDANAGTWWSFTATPYKVFLPLLAR